ncbi:sigma-70 family RNA polymerase sigma factor [Streptomyces sp. NPDC057580]|uniref:sigma-70 family RNA polymerase sigma factor n=1 Tax=Streptomyces sp. NPDC057580 TaxID=3346173 RepID=UPI00368C428E
MPIASTHLGAALARLDEREQQALMLRYGADLPVKECAEVLGVGIDNMKKILKAALRKLRQSLRMDGYETAGTAKKGHR